MIGKLTGRLDEVGPSTLIVDVNGVGYEVTCAAFTLAGLPAVGEIVTLAIDTHMREDSIRLYGFATEHERAWFRALQTVQGVGAKVALAVLGTLDAADLANAVALQDKAMVARAPGVGPKVAARIVAELKDKMPSLAPAIRPGGGVTPVARRGVGADQSRLWPRPGRCRGVACRRQGRARGAHRGVDPPRT
jgi:Holliday junction DNA helicase RuvA